MSVDPRFSPTGLPVVGMVGGGQLSRMTQQAAIALGVSLRVLAENRTDAAADVAPHTTVGSHTSLADLRAFAEVVDVVTFDHEHVPGEHLRALEAAGVEVLPGSAALLHAQDKLVQRRRLSALGLPVPAFAEVPSGPDAAAAVVAFGDAHGWPVMVKAVRGGYDGKGVWTVDDEAGAAELCARAEGVALYVEERVELRRELSALVARSPFGQAAAWPVVQTVQSDGICVEVLAPAPDLDLDDAAAAHALALTVASELDVVGVMAVEMFQTPTGALLVNELAMRPHNSGHWTIEGARTSQFEQHLRAVLDLPFGSTAVTAPWAVMANLLGGESPTDPHDDLFARVHHVMAMDPAARIHLYGKNSRPGRKIGHVTVLGDDLADCRHRAASAAAYLRHGGPHDGTPWTEPRPESAP